MREACIIIPRLDQAGHSALVRINEAVSELCQAFGGCTQIAGHGAWVNPATGQTVSEPVFQLLVAVPFANHHNREYQRGAETLTRIACTLAKEMDQNAVYVRFGTGDVRIFDRAEIEQFAEKQSAAT